MCGIFCLYNFPTGSTGNKLRHRGPDDFRVFQNGNCVMEFSRLSINDTTEAGMQPFVSDGKMLMCNGEIYNHDSLSTDQKKPGSGSDCECLMPHIDEHGLYETAKAIRGVFAICYHDGKHLHVARDPLGVRPLFYARPTPDSLVFASEIKAIKTVFTTKCEIFPPGHVYDTKSGTFRPYFECDWTFPRELSFSNPFDLVRKTFIQAVHRRVTNTDREMCCLLSGGLDSSLVAAVAKMFVPKLKTFSVGTTDSPDRASARRVAKFLDTDHTEVDFTPDMGLDAMYSVVRCIESYDTTTIRASIPMWLLAKYISEKTPCRVVLTGEGSDELFGGYLYFHYAPDTEAFFEETKRRLHLIHQFDVLRCDRTISAHGLEARVPFLDIDFVNAMMTIDQSFKFKKGEMEKWVLRKAFEGYLPDEVLWRQKDAFSDAVGYSWVKALKTQSETIVSDDLFKTITERCENNIPLTKEEAMYRELFHEMYGNYNSHLISEIWRPKWTDETDPSATALKVYKHKN